MGNLIRYEDGILYVEVSMGFGTFRKLNKLENNQQVGVIDEKVPLPCRSFGNSKWQEEATLEKPELLDPFSFLQLS